MLKVEGSLEASEQHLAVELSRAAAFPTTLCAADPHVAFRGV